MIYRELQKPGKNYLNYVFKSTFLVNLEAFILQSQYIQFSPTQFLQIFLSSFWTFQILVLIGNIIPHQCVVCADFMSKLVRAYSNQGHTMVAKVSFFLIQQYFSTNLLTNRIPDPLVSKNSRSLDLLTFESLMCLINERSVVNLLPKKITACRFNVKPRKNFL